MSRTKNKTSIKSKWSIVLLIFAMVLCAVFAGGFATNHINIIDSNAVAASEEQDSYTVKTNSYNLEDNTGYVTKGKNPTTNHPLANKSAGINEWASISIDLNTPSGMITSEGTRMVGGKAIGQYGVVAGNELTTQPSLLDLRLKYNYYGTKPINNDWHISEDTAISVDGYGNIGVIDSGALLVSKSYDGINWEWEKPGYSNELANNFHTTKFTSTFKPEYYWNDDNKLTIYTPSGKDIARGVYIKVVFAYEIKREEGRWVDGTWTWLTGQKDYETYWVYRNIVEESVFYIASNSAVVAFSNASQDNETDGSISELIKQAGTIKNEHGTLKGFRLNKLNNASFDVQYRIKKPGMAASTYQPAYDGQFFSETGRYDFKITTSLGHVEEYSVFVNNLDINGAVRLYFGNQNDIAEKFITSDSKRIFSMSDEIPVYIAGETHYKINALDQAYMPVAGTIKNLDTGATIRKIEGDYTQKAGTIFEPGIYEAEFFSNKDYESELSGDVYHFVFKFKVISQNEVPGPVLNQQLLNNLIGFADLQSSYYGVAISTAGAGRAIYAFRDYSSALGFAYEYEKSKVVATQNGYTYYGESFSSQFDVLDKVNKNASLIIEKRYFNPADGSTFLTLAPDDFVDDVSALNISTDIIVFRSEVEQIAMKSGEPFLNDRVYRTISLDGVITQNIVPVKFIQVANYESSRVILTHEATGNSFPIDYNVSVEQQLQDLNAPSGRYIITESTNGTEINDSVVYYAVYIKKGDITASISIDTLFNGTVSTKLFTKADNNLPTTVNCFILNSAVNPYDSQTLVEVVKDGIQVFFGTIAEISGQAFYEDGSYKVNLIDRLGNSCTFVFNIYQPIRSIKVTFDNDGEITTKTVYEGQAISLGEPTKEGFIFAGWQSGNTRYNGTYVVSGGEDLVFKAVWHYPSVSISVYDGELFATYIKNVEDIQVLPILTKNGYTLVGWYYSEGKNQGRIYVGQITSVPNTSSMRLDAIWRKNITTEIIEKSMPDCTHITFVHGGFFTTIYAEYGSEVDLRSITEQMLAAAAETGDLDDLEFFGWQYTKAQLTGTIYTAGVISSVPEVESMVLYALFKTKASTQEHGGGAAGTTASTGNSDTAGTNGFLSKIFSGNGLIITGCVFSVVLILLVLFICKKKGPFSKIAKTAESGVTGLKEAKVSYAVCNKEIEHEKRVKRFKLYKKIKNRPDAALAIRRGWWKMGTLIGCLILAAVLGAQAIMYSFMPYARSLQLEQQSINNMTLSESLEPKRDSTLINKAIERLGLTSQDLEDGELNSEEKSFLIAVVMVDYMSFGYNVFPATIDISGEKLLGLAYTEKEIYKKENGFIYYACGFAALPDEDEPIIIAWYNEDVIIEPVSQDDVENNSAYIFSFAESYIGHYIANDNYVIYEVNNFTHYIDYFVQDNDISNYDSYLGAIYNYDLGRIVYDPNLGYNSLNLSARGLNTFTDYDVAMDVFRSFITTQNNNGLQVNSVTSSYVSYAAINEYLLNNQDESFLGISAEEIYQFQSSLTHTEYYLVAVNEETGENELIKLNFPPPPPEPKSFWEKILDVLNEWGGALLSVGLIIGGLVVTCFAGPVVGGAMLGAGLELFSQCVIEGKKLTEVNWLRIGVAAVAGAIAGTGIGMVAAGFISGALYALESIWENRDALDTWQAWVNVGMDFINGFQRGVLINSIVHSPVLCFVAGTGVATIEGIKAIENIRKGDLVASRNDLTGEIEYKEVKQLFKNQTNELIRLKLTNGGEIVSTLEHPYFVVNKNYYIDAKNLRAGDILQTVNGKTVIVEQIQHEILENPVTVYNFEVQDNHNYFVGNGGFDGFVLAHNACKTDAGTAGSLPGTGTNTGTNTGDLTELGKLLGQLGAQLGDISLSQLLTNELKKVKDRVKAETKPGEEPDPVHHIVAQTAPMAEGSRMILARAFISKHNEVNLIPLPEAYHAPLHTYQYHAKIYVLLIEACNRAADKIDIDRFENVPELSKLENFIKLLTLTEAEITEIGKNIKALWGSGQFKNFLSKFDTEGSRLILQKEIVDTLEYTIKPKLASGSFMTEIF